MLREKEMPAPVIRDETFELPGAIPETGAETQNTAGDIVAWLEWFCAQAGVKDGELSICVHEKHVSKVVLTIESHFDPRKSEAADADQLRAQLNAVEQSLRQSKGHLGLSEVCRCLQYGASILLRRSPFEFGTIAMKIKHAKIVEVRPLPVIRLDRKSALARLAKYLFPRA